MSTRFLRLLDLAAPAAVFVPALAVIDCGGVPFTAPSGAVLQISANPTAIPVVDGVSTITVLGFKSADDGGGPLPDGTQVFFTTNVGVIEERVEMQNGVARAFLRSNGRAGTAKVTATSGPGGETPATVDVFIGNAGEGFNIVLTANPPTVGPPDFTTEILATAFDNDNNPLRDVPIIFSTTAGALASQGSIIRTNAQGQALDRLTLKNEASASVTAISGSVSSTPVTVARGDILRPVVSSVFPSSSLPGETLTVTITGLNFQPGATVSFGEGIGINSVTFVSSTQLIVSITIDPNARIRERTVTVTNPDGGSGSLPSGFVVGSQPPFISSITPSASGTRDMAFTLIIDGANFQSGAVVSFDPGGIQIQSPPIVSATRIQVEILIRSFANGGPPSPTTFDVTVLNPDGGSDTLVNGFTAQ